MDINGWDVVYACTGAYMNSELQKNPSQCIQGFQYTDANLAISGTFGTWQIVPGGSGSFVRMAIPIVSGTATLVGSAAICELDDVIAVVQMQLSLGSPASGSSDRVLKFNCQKSGSAVTDLSDGAVYVVTPDSTGVLAGRANGALASALLATALTEVFINNRDQLSFLFAQIMPVPDAGSAWLTMEESAFVYQQPNDQDLGNLAILGMIEQLDTSNQPLSFDNRLLAPGSTYGFMLSAEKFMEKIVLPGLPAAYGGNCTTNNLTMAEGKIVLNSGFHLDHVKSGAIYYTPEVTSLSYEITTSSMRCFTATKTDITGLVGAYVVNSVTSNNQSQFSIASNSLSFLADPNEAVTSDPHIPKWEKDIGVLTLGIMNLVITCVSDAIEHAVSSSVSGKTAQSLGAVGPSLVAWHGQTSFSSRTGGLEDNFYMSGVLQ